MAGFHVSINGRFLVSPEVLGHSNIATTDTYLNAISVELQKSIRHYDEVRTICREFASELPSERRPSRKSEQPSGDKSSVH